MALLEIDGYDLHPHLRTQPGEGFQPMDGDKIVANFSEAGLTEGQPLISINEENGEWVIPLHLNPGKAGMPNTRQGLNTLQQNVVRRLKAAKTLKWQDEGVAQPTFYDVEFARLEPEYSFWRARKLYLSCTVRVWTRPYGHTGTFRTTATIAKPVSAMAIMPLGSIAGDADAQLRVRTSIGTAFHYNGATTSLANQETGNVLVTVVPNGFPVTRTPSSIPALGFAPGSVVGASGAVASLAFRSSFSGAQHVGGLYIAAADVDDRPHRILGLMRVVGQPAGSVGVEAYLGQPNRLLGPEVTVPKGGQWGLVDLGRLHVRDAEFGATMMIPVRARHYSGAGATISVETTEMYVVPEDSTVLLRETVFAHATGLATVPYVPSYMLTSAGAAPRVEFGTAAEPLAGAQRGRMPHVPPGGAHSVAVLNARTGGGAAVARTVSVEVEVRERFTFAR